MNPIPQCAAALLLGATLAGAPTSQVQVTLTSVRDNTLYAISDGSLSNGRGDGMFAGVTIGGEVRRALLAFDVGNAIPPGATVVAVSLQLSATASASAPGDVSVHRVLASWGEGASVGTNGGGGGGAGGPVAPGDATWLHRFHPGTLWTTAGGDYAATASATTTVAGLGAQVWGSTPALVADVQGWVDDPSTDFGWLLRTPEALTDRTRRFATREFAIVAERPRLLVTYVPRATFAPFGAGCTGSAGVPGLGARAGSLPVLGGVFELELTGLPPDAALALGVLGFSNTVNDNGVGRYSLPFDLSGIGMPGCSQLVAADVLVTLAVDSGRALWSLPIASQPGLAGLVFHAQGIVLDPRANAAGVTTTGGGTGTIGS